MNSTYMTLFKSLRVRKCSDTHMLCRIDVYSKIACSVLLKPAAHSPDPPACAAMKSVKEEKKEGKKEEKKEETTTGLKFATFYKSMLRTFAEQQVCGVMLHDYVAP